MLIVPANYRRLDGSQRVPARGAKRVGPADPTETLSVTIRVRRQPGAPALPDYETWAATPPGQRKFMSRQDFAARYGAAQADLDRVCEFARAHGLAVVKTSIARRVVIVSGTVEQTSRAFAVELGRYESPTESYRGREGHIHLPNDVADVVEGVFGLDNRQMARPLALRATARPEDVVPLTPPTVADLYKFPSPANAAGQVIGVIEFSGPTPQAPTCGYTPSDIQAFFANLGLTTPVLNPIEIDGAPNAPSGNPESADVQVALDIDVAGSVAQGAEIAIYFAPWTEQGWADAVTTAVHPDPESLDPVASVLSISWGWPENESADGFTWTPAAIKAVSSTFQDAAFLGVTVLVASGDNGSDCGIGDKKAHVLYPASDPFVTCCGGTTINLTTSSFTQSTWSDPFGGTTGGGISDLFPLPPWQIGAHVPVSVNDGHIGRGIPDVAGNGDPNSGYTLVVGGASVGPIGGTSAVAPLYAGLVALLNARLSNCGYLNPTLYASAASPGLYQDIADGASNATGGAKGYTSGPGWDACTGFGSINGNALLTALQSLPVPELVKLSVPSSVELLGTAQVVLSLPALPGGASVVLTSSNPAIADVPGTILVEPANPTANFSIIASNVTSATEVTITAAYRGVSLAAAVQIVPFVPPPPQIKLEKFVVGPASVKGGIPATGEVTLNRQAPPLVGTRVALKSSNPAIAMVPGFVTVPAGRTQQTFGIPTMTVATQHDVQISAQEGGVTKLALLIIDPP